MGDVWLRNRKHNYDESKIKTLSSLEHIRLRTGMYIGRIGNGAHYDDGCYILLKEVIDNAIDEFIMGHGKRGRDRRSRAAACAVRDFGRGIPLGKVVDCVSKINTGAKYNDDVFQFSVGLNGVGTKAVNALSKAFLVRSHRDGRVRRGRSSSSGKLQEGERAARPSEPDGTFIEFEPDPEIFKEIEFRPEHIERRLRHYSYLNTGLRLIYNGKAFQSRHGLMDLVMEDLAGRRQRADLPAAALREQDAGVLLHPQQQPLRRDVLLVRQRPVHQRRRHAPERVPRGPAQGGQRVRATASSRATTCARAWSARWPSG